MGKISVALVGATGETGKSILNGLVEDGTFASLHQAHSPTPSNLFYEQEITLIVRPQSISKPSTQALASHGFSILPIDASNTVDSSLLEPFSIIISAVDNFGYDDQSRLATAAKAAGVQRFVPCGFTTIAPPGGVMSIRDAKEAAYNHILQLKLGYTIIDVGFWHQASIPRVPSSKVDYALFPGTAEMSTKLIGDGNAKNLLTDLRDVGRLVARIVKDPRTLNKKVVTWSDELSQNEIFEVVEKLSGETIERTYVPNDEVMKEIVEAREPFAGTQPETLAAETIRLWGAEYTLSKYVREDNTLGNAKYLGYLDARELYSNFQPMKFEDAAKEAVNGKAVKLYEGRF
jgi:uncharacterized protein YbjT (DUF2867 family)